MANQFDEWRKEILERLVGGDFKPTLDAKLHDLDEKLTSLGGGSTIDNIYVILQEETKDYPELHQILAIWQEEDKRTKGSVSLDLIAQKAGYKASRFYGLLHEILYAYDDNTTELLVREMRPILIKTSLLNALHDVDERKQWMQRFGYFPLAKSSTVGDVNVSVNAQAVAQSDAKSIAADLPILRDDLHRTQQLTRGKLKELPAASEVIECSVRKSSNSKSDSSRKAIPKTASRVSRSN